MTPAYMSLIAEPAILTATTATTTGTSVCDAMCEHGFKRIHSVSGMQRSSLEPDPTGLPTRHVTHLKHDLIERALKWSRGVCIDENAKALSSFARTPCFRC
ncbi:hypothetical protein KQX54_010570 [Cotesia glomerata]|uniref:Uncharacterized protein n=1 Tax=Cotesia glomerata TaxID=32391 RepID=A0AAV7IMF8_COTGL|nr:hypothetical protein KQX54_010570 [Cotesia glomerata]